MKRKQYNREFKLEAVRRLKLREQSVTSLADELDVPRNKLYRWQQEVKKKGELEAFRGVPGPKPANARLDEVEQLRRRVAQLEEENAILKKAEAYFTDNPE
jgi:transposase